MGQYAWGCASCGVVNPAGTQECSGCMGGYDPLTTVVNLRREPFDVYIGRAGKGHDGFFGNPFPVQNLGRKVALERFKEYFYKRLSSDGEYRRRVLELKGKRLGCFCRPLLCHGDWLAVYADKFG